MPCLLCESCVFGRFPPTSNMHTGHVQLYSARSLSTGLAGSYLTDILTHP